GSAMGDLDEAGALDSTTAAATDDAIELLRGSGTGNFALPVPTPSLDNVQTVFVRDFDGDGHLDVLAASPTVAELWLYPGDGTGALLAPHVVPVPASAGVGVADLDGVFWPDFVLCDERAGSVQAWLSEGALGLRPQAVTRTTWPTLPLVADLDDDGLADVAVTAIGDDGTTTTVAVLH